MDDEDEVPTCPLCLEELDATDRAVRACQCGYQVCLLCLHQIREGYNGKCPACRTPYKEDNFRIVGVDHEAAAKEAKERANAKKERERREKLAALQREREQAQLVSQQKAKTNIKQLRIVQRNLVYIIGLSLSLAREEVLRRAEMFGKFGRIARVLVNRAHPYNADMPGGPSISAYVLYTRDIDANNAVRQMNLTVFDGREIRCSIACTKYCDVFVRAGITQVGVQLHCGNPACLYVHEIVQSDDVLNREEVLARQLGPPPPAHLFGPMPPVSQQRRPTATTTRQQAPPNPTRPRPSNAQPNGVAKRTTTSNASTSSPVSQPTRRPNNSVNSRRSPPSSPEARRRTIHNSKSPSVRNGTAPVSNTTPVHAQSASTTTQNNASWKQVQPLRSVVRSPPRSSPSPTSTPVQDGTPRRKPSITQPPPQPPPVSQAVPPERSPPPGFAPIHPKVDRSPGVPSKPPGFDEPVIKQRPLRNAVSPPTTPNIPSPLSRANGPPPGFAAKPAAVPNEPKVADINSQQSPSIHASMAWLKEASSDQIVTSQDMLRGRPAVAPIGVPVSAPSPSSHQRGNQQSNPGFVDVLGRIGGSLGVSSEVNLNPAVTPYPPAPTSSRMNMPNLYAHGAPGSSSSLGMPYNDSHPQAQAPPPGMAPVSQSMYHRGQIFNDPINRNAAEIKQSKRSNSRFGFARDNFDPRPMASPMAHASPELGVHLLYGDPVYSGGCMRANNNVVPIGRSYLQQSRFDFAESSRLPHVNQPQASPVHHQPPMVAHPATNPHFGFPQFAPQQTRVAPANMDPAAPHAGDLVNGAFTDKFSQMTTADKLASLFNQAQWAPGALPPMPQIEGGVEATNEMAFLAEHAPAPSPRENASASASANAFASSPPPGFRQATSEKPPEARNVRRPGVAVDNEDSHGGEVAKRSKNQKKRERRRGRKGEAKSTFGISPTAPSASEGQPHVSSAQELGERDVLGEDGRGKQAAQQTSRQASQASRQVAQQAPPRQGAAQQNARQMLTVSELEREVKAAREREQMLQSRLVDLQRRIERYGKLIN